MTNKQTNTNYAQNEQNLAALIRELCPEGVEFKELQDVLKIKNGSGYKDFGEGNIPVYGSGGIMAYIDRFAYDKPSVLIPRKGSLDKLYYVDTPFWNIDTIFYTEINTNVAIPKYVYHCLLKAHLEKLDNAGGVPSLTQKVLNQVKIPVPPLPIQAEIVRILDAFTELTVRLTAELTAELTARKKQYEYYRDYLLDFSKLGGVIQRIKLGDICRFETGDQLNKDVLTPEGPYAVYNGGVSPSGYHTRYNTEGETIIISQGGASAGFVNWIDAPFWAGAHCYRLQRLDANVNKRFLFFWLKNSQTTLQNSKRGAGIPGLNRESIESLIFPLPPLPVQQRIVDVLDNFDAVCNSLRIGLPAEIDARKKQYEYYRDLILNFYDMKEGRKEGRKLPSTINARRR